MRLLRYLATRDGVRVPVTIVRTEFEVELPEGKRIRIPSSSFDVSTNAYRFMYEGKLHVQSMNQYRATFSRVRFPDGSEEWRKQGEVYSEYSIGRPKIENKKAP